MSANIVRRLNPLRMIAAFEARWNQAVEATVNAQCRADEARQIRVTGTPSERAAYIAACARWRADGRPGGVWSLTLAYRQDGSTS
jgi:hypothetical protein